MGRQHEVCTRILRQRLRSRLLDTKFVVRSKFPLSLCFVVFLSDLINSFVRMFLDCWELGFWNTPSGQ